MSASTEQPIHGAAHEGTQADAQAAGGTRHHIGPGTVTSAPQRNEAPPASGTAQSPESSGDAFGAADVRRVSNEHADLVVDFRAVFGALPAGVALLTPDLLYVEANPAYLRLAGRERRQILGRYVFDE